MNMTPFALLGETKTMEKAALMRMAANGLRSGARAFAGSAAKSQSARQAALLRQTAAGGIFSSAPNFARFSNMSPGEIGRLTGVGSGRLSMAEKLHRGADGIGQAGGRLADWSRRAQHSVAQSSIGQKFTAGMNAGAEANGPWSAMKAGWNAGRQPRSVASGGIFNGGAAQNLNKPVNWKTPTVTAAGGIGLGSTMSGGQSPFHGMPMTPFPR